MGWRFWQRNRNKVIDLGSITFRVPPGPHKVTYSVKFDGHNVDKTIIVTPSITELDKGMQAAKKKAGFDDANR